MAEAANGATLTEARPGGHMRPFCEPHTTTSTPQASCGSGCTPRLVMASTTSFTPRERVILATASMSWIAPVDVSLWVE
jgi:hypothetical protein